MNNLIERTIDALKDATAYGAGNYMTLIDELRAHTVEQGTEGSVAERNDMTEDKLKIAIKALKIAKAAIKGREHTGFIDVAIATLTAQETAEPMALSDEQIAMHVASKCGAWENWESAKDFCDTLSGNDPDEERDYWIGIVSEVRSMLNMTTMT